MKIKATIVIKSEALGDIDIKYDLEMSDNELNTLVTGMSNILYNVLEQLNKEERD